MGHGALTVSPTASRGPRCRSGPARRATRRSGRASAATRNRPRGSAARDTRASSWSPSVATSGLAQTARDAECSNHRNEVQEIGILARRARLRVEAFGGRNTCTVFRARLQHHSDRTKYCDAAVLQPWAKKRHLRGHAKQHHLSFPGHPTAIRSASPGRGSLRCWGIWCTEFRSSPLSRRMRLWNSEKCN
jgi:hypothetical protein